MAVLNITPDSFSDPGRLLDPHAALEHALRAIDDGAYILDLGAEASSFFRPGIRPVPADEQLRRLLPILQRLIPQLPPGILLSVDTRSAAVARAALDAGAHLINDISAGTHDPDLLPTVARYPHAAIAVMHISPNYPATPAADDPDILATVRTYLHDRLQAALAAGIPSTHIALDPGIGFGKTMPDNWTLALHASDLLPPHAQAPLILGASRKRFLETPPPVQAHAPLSRLLATLPPPSDAAHPRDPLTAALTLHTTQHWPPASPPLIHRIHNVTLLRSALTMLQNPAPPATPRSAPT
jgi:dihydropteroate synthase